MAMVEERLPELFHLLATTRSADERLLTLDALLAALEARTLRDVEPDAPLLAALLHLLPLAWRAFPAAARAKLDLLLAGLLALPEWAAAAPLATPLATPPLVDAALERLALPAAEDAAPSPAEAVAAPRALLEWMYRGMAPLRPRLRLALGEALLSMGAAPLPPPGLRAALELCAAIAAGFGAPRAAHAALVLEVLLPLHRQSARLDSTTAALSLFHEPLVHCLVVCLTHDPALLAPLLPALAALWPAPREGNSPKEVLLLHELERLLELTPPALRAGAAHAVSPVVCRCIASDNSRIAESALTLFANGRVKEVLLADPPRVWPPLMRALVREGVPHWNATVNKMTHEVLSLMLAQDASSFAFAADLCLADATPAASPPTAAASLASAASAGYAPMRAPWGGGGSQAPPRGFQPHSRMPAAAPPPKRAPRAIPGMPAPVEQSFSLDLPRVTAAADAEAAAARREEAAAAAAAEGGEEKGGGGGGGGEGEGAAGPPSTPGVRRVKEYMARIRPSDEELRREAPLPPSEREHLTEAPTLLPTIIFQELVFGADIGSGSFSTVRYCKHVQRDRPAKSWPEYAAKVLRSQLMRELGYEPAVRREIAILRQLKHPGIARLVSSFRWKDDVYLLLEYAARGDLHSLLRRFGSLAEPNARFVFAEVAVALESVHAVGYAYSDLKPENVVLTASGHAKLTDFGAARPLPGHAAAKAAIAAARNVIVQLRDGDWRARREGTDVPAVDAGMELEEEEEDDGLASDSRLEGTAAYLSPELVQGGQPTEGSDLWAFGCTLYQALCGKPPLWAEGNEAMFRGIVRFKEMTTDHFPESTPDDARDLISRLLVPDLASRLDMAAVQSHAFFGGLDMQTLYNQTPPPLSQGITPPAPNASWSRRQNSMMWSPLPQRYDFGATPDSLEAIPETSLEADAPFVATRAPIALPVTKLGNVAEDATLREGAPPQLLSRSPLSST